MISSILMPVPPGAELLPRPATGRDGPAPLTCPDSAIRRFLGRLAPAG